MIAPPIPHRESERLKSLTDLNLLDTAPEERFDRFTRLAKHLFRVPIALVSLVDAQRQWFKSRQGLDATETSRTVSFCGHAILGQDLMMVPDARRDERFVDNPLVTEDPSIRFYAGYPISSPDGAKIGTLCIIDREPRMLSDEEIRSLSDLGTMVEAEIAALELATSDELTGLSNRRGFRTIAAHTIAMCRRVGRDATLLYIDLDGFKQINDEQGHAEGDRVLDGFANMLLDSFRDSDVIARLGGDEFCVLLTGAGEDGFMKPLHELDARVGTWNADAANRGRLAYSVGFVRYDPARHDSIDALLGAADEMMYEQKRGRKEERSRPGA